jgi:hypothetical protein
MTKKVREVINTHEQLQCSGGGVAIIKNHAPGRDARFCGWAIYRVNAAGVQIATATDAAWYDRGKKTFSTFGRGRMEALQEAKDFVAKKFGYGGKWVRNRMGDYIPAEVHKRFPLRKRA